MATTPANETSTPHYHGYNYVLVRLELAEPDAVFELIGDAWHIAATATLRKRHASG